MWIRACFCVLFVYEYRCEFVRLRLCLWICICDITTGTEDTLQGNRDQRGTARILYQLTIFAHRTKGVLNMQGLYHILDVHLEPNDKSRLHV